MHKFALSILLLTLAATEILSQLVQTRLGSVQGKTENVGGRNYAVFLGIPFAEPPLGPLRFQDTSPINPWAPGTVYANGNYSKVCPQQNAPFDPASQSEDCLYLNIFTQPNANRLPVMVWIHGGALFIGSASEYPVKGILRNFVSHDVLVVSINYRLGILGFWNLHSPTAGGNFGFLDQTVALEWIKTNIDSFGGDPDKITIFGESAGSGSVSMLTLSPLSQGFFNQAIMQSGSGLSPWGLNDDSDTVDPSRQIQEYLGCAGSEQPYGQQQVDQTRQNEMAILRCMQSKSVSDIISAQNDNLPQSGYLSWTGRIDGRFLPEEPERLAAKRPSINVIIGCTKDEMALFEFVGGVTGQEPGPTETPEALKESFPKYFVRDKFTNIRAAEAAAEYTYISSVKFEANSARYPADFWLDQAVKMKSGVMFWAPAYKEAVSFANSGANVYLYSMDYVSPNTLKDSTWKGVVHAADIFYQFHSGGQMEIESGSSGATAEQLSMLGLAPIPESRSDRRMAEFFHDTWTNFAKYGNPTPQPVNGVTWERLDPDQSNYMSINMPPRMEQGFHTQDVLFWNELIPKLQESNSVCKRAKQMKSMSLFVYYATYC